MMWGSVAVVVALFLLIGLACSIPNREEKRSVETDWSHGESETISRKMYISSTYGKEIDASEAKWFRDEREVSTEPIETNGATEDWSPIESDAAVGDDSIETFLAELNRRFDALKTWETDGALAAFRNESVNLRAYRQMILSPTGEWNMVECMHDAGDAGQLAGRVRSNVRVAGFRRRTHGRRKSRR